LEGSELFMFTDNMTAESAFYRGTSSERSLFDLILRLRKFQMHRGLFVHVIHVAGIRMKGQGTDGLSRGSVYDGIMKGDDMMKYVPLHLSALDREHRLKNWVLDWMGDFGKVNWLSPFDWYWKGHKENRCVWTPPPAAADAALEQLAQAKHKRPCSEHVVLIPRLMTAYWRKQLGKICDLVVTVPLGCDVWNISQYEPLVLGISFSLSRHQPWRLRGTPIMDRVEKQLSSLPSTSLNWGRNILHELFIQTRKLESMSPGMVRPMLQCIGSGRVSNCKTP
jgi:hypothetical protein